MEVGERKGGAQEGVPRVKEAPLRVGVNGVWHTIGAREAAVKDIGLNTTLIEYLRETCRLTGTKLGCGVGGCGVCTVMISRRAVGGAATEHKHMNSCLLPLFSLHGAHVTTVEGVGSPRDPHPVQTQIADLHGSQCGFCTPGAPPRVASPHPRAAAARLVTPTGPRAHPTCDVCAVVQGW